MDRFCPLSDCEGDVDDAAGSGALCFGAGASAMDPLALCFGAGASAMDPLALFFGAGASALAFALERRPSALARGPHFGLGFSTTFGLCFGAMAAEEDAAEDVAEDAAEGACNGKRDCTGTDCSDRWDPLAAVCARRSAMSRTTWSGMSRKKGMSASQDSPS